MPKPKDPYLVLGIPRGADLSEIKRAYRKLVITLHPDQSQDARDAERLRDVQRAYETLGDPVARHVHDITHATSEAGDGRQEVPVHRSSAGVIREQRSEPLTYSRWRHGVRFDPEPFATQAARGLANRARTRFAPIDEQLGGIVPEVFANRPPSSPKDLFVEVALTREEARTGGTFELTIPLQISCKACLGSGLGALTVNCSHCKGRGYTVDHRTLELVVPAEVSDGQQARMQLGGAESTTELRVLVKLV